MIFVFHVDADCGGVSRRAGSGFYVGLVLLGDPVIAGRFAIGRLAGRQTETDRIGIGNGINEQQTTIDDTIVTGAGCNTDSLCLSRSLGLRIDRTDCIDLDASSGRTRTG